MREYGALCRICWTALTLTGNIKVEDIALQYNDNRYCLGSLTYQRKLGRGQLAVVKDVSGRWRSNTKKGPVDKRLSIAEITFHDEDGQRRLVLDSLNYMTDNHRPRKNHHKPKHGAFDVGHLNVNLHLEADISYMDKDSIVATVEGRASDKVTGIDLRKLDMRLSATKRQIDLSDVVIQQAWTIQERRERREERGKRREERGEKDAGLQGVEHYGPRAAEGYLTALCAGIGQVHPALVPEDQHERRRQLADIQQRVGEDE